MGNSLDEAQEFLRTFNSLGVRQGVLLNPPSRDIRKRRELV